MPLALTGRGWGVLLAALGFWAGWLVVGLRDIWYLVAFLAALLAVALVFVVAIPLVARIEVRLSASDPTPEAGETVALTATLRHRLPIAMRIGILWALPGDRRTGEARTPAGEARIPAGEPAAVRIEWVPERRGPASIRLAAVTLRDPLGLLVRRSRPDEALEILVLPRLLDDLADLIDGGGVLDSDARLGSRASSLGSGSPGGSVRGYRTGDPLRQIHWKQSARQGELLVNLPEDPGSEERSLYLDTGRASGAGEDFELAVSAAATLALHWLHRGHPVVLRLGGDRPTTAASESEALRALARVQPDAAELDARGSAVAEPSFDGVDVLVAGTLTSRISERLSSRPGLGGLLLVVRRDPDAAVPGSWRMIPIPAPGPDPASDPGRGAGLFANGTRFREERRG